MKKIKTSAFLLLSIILSFFNSCNFLDVDDYFNETMKYDSIFSNKINFERYIWGAAALFPEEGAIFGNNYTPGPMATDEGFCLFSTGEFRGMGFALGEITPTNLYNMNIWDKMYQIIRKSNLMLSRIDEVKDLTVSQKGDLLGYIHFLRGYAYYHLLMQYGPAVILGDEILESNETPEYYNRSRATYDETVDYTCNELEEAAKYLKSDVSVNLFGRPTKEAAYGLIARTRLQHASPAFNGQPAAKRYFGDWTRKEDGALYVSQQYDEKRWAMAAAAAKRIIDTERFSLHTVEKQKDTPVLPSNVSSRDFPDGAGNIDPFRSYSNIFTGEALMQRNPEFVWGRFSSNVVNYSKHSFMVANMGGWNGMCVTQKIVDAHYMVDGRDLNNSSAEHPYSDDGFMGGADKSFSNYTLKSSVSNMYVNREMRFYANIGFSECLWTAASTSESGRKNRVATYYLDGNAGKASAGSNVNDYPITGYVLRKYVHEDDAWAGADAQRVQKPFPIIRYAEILLSYVEALNNLTTSHTIVDAQGVEFVLHRDVEQIKYYFNQIRFRAGLPGITEVNPSVKLIQELLERERMIEFLFENRRYYDVRRWGIYEESERQMIMGMDTESTKSKYYTRVMINHPRARNRNVDRKLMFMPISLSELRKSTLLDQNPGWDN